MKFTLSWLKDHLQTVASLGEIADKLTPIGLEVEDILNPGQKLQGFVVARVLEAAPHPNADKLRVCQVNAGQGPVQVVCGAPNARAGLIGVFAPPGVYVPGSDFTIGKAAIRGVESAGMLCSERELLLSQEHEGIIELPESAAAHVGEPYASVAGLDDPVIDIAITANRGDCLGVRGVARDLAAAGLGKLKPEVPGYKGKGDFPCPIAVELKFDDDAKSACPVFYGRVIRGVTNGPSPEWLQKRLKAVGLRPINALADITNYIALDRARPLHVYDADKLKGAVHARLGRRGETFLALDGKTYDVDEAMCVIADDDGVLGLGGVMGGEATGCTAATVNVFVESAYFDPVRTAMTGRKTGILSDARYRFERGVDPLSAPQGLDLATAMILKICGGSPSERALAGRAPERNHATQFDPALVERLSGAKFSHAEILNCLKKLGFEVEGKAPALLIGTPSWRPDIHGAADLVEEVVRLHGADRIPATPLPREPGVAKPVLTPSQIRLSKTRRTLAARGLTEAITWSFIPRAHAALFGGGQDELELANPISRDMSSMRPSLLPGLAMAASANAKRSAQEAALFEVGQAFRGDAPGDQFSAAAGLRMGLSRIGGHGRHWDGPNVKAGFADAKADAFAALAACGFDAAKAQITREAPPWFHPGRSGAIKLGPKTALGYFGELHPSVTEAFELPDQVAAFEVFLDRAPAPRKKSAAKPALILPDLQPVRRDFAFAVPRGVLSGDVVRAVQAAGGKLVAKVTVFDVFEGGTLADGLKSLGVEATLQPFEKTLTDQEIEQVCAKIAESVRKATGGEIRA